MNTRANDSRRALRGKYRRRRAFISIFMLLFISAAIYTLLERNQPWKLQSDEAPAQTEANLTPPETTEREATKREDTKRETTVEKADASLLPPPEESCDSLKVLVGRKHALPPDYQPKDLVSLSARGVPTAGSDYHMIRRVAAEPLGELVSAAASDGEALIVLSAYRSYARQRQNFAHFTGVYGEDAEEVSAPPGQSQHQLGTTVDFTNAEVNYQLLPTFGKTSASKWLEDNAWKHGFIITYPDNDEAGTGRQWEPWEYRFVGVETAKRVHESGLSLRKYLVKVGVRPRC